MTYSKQSFAYRPQSFGKSCGYKGNARYKALFYTRESTISHTNVGTRGRYDVELIVQNTNNNQR